VTTLSMDHEPWSMVQDFINRKEHMTKENINNKTEERQNRFSGESIFLTKEEAKIHDSIFYYEYLATLEDKKVGFDGHSKIWDKVRKGIDYFRQHNAEAYMVLLD
jgi:hypothetical protein